MNYDNPIIKLLETLGNMIIVSILWLLFSLPIITLVPATAALYNTCANTIFSRGKTKGIVKVFVKSFKENIHPGLMLTIVVLLATFFMIVGINTGLQIYKLNAFGAFYMILGIAIGLIIYPAVIYIPIVLSRFVGKIDMVLRLSIYFAMQNILVNILFALLFIMMLVAIYIFPLFLLVVPALYMDLIRPHMEKKIRGFIELSGMNKDEDIQEETEKFDLEAMYDFERSLDVRKRKENDEIKD